MGDYLKPPEQVAETILRYLQELGWEMGPSSAERIRMMEVLTALQAREDDRQRAYHAIQEAGRIIWDLLGEAPVPGGLPMARHDEIHAWLQHWTPEVFPPPILQAPEAVFPDGEERI